MMITAFEIVGPDNMLRPHVFEEGAEAEMRANHEAHDRPIGKRELVRTRNLPPHSALLSCSICPPVTVS